MHSVFHSFFQTPALVSRIVNRLKLTVNCINGWCHRRRGRCRRRLQCHWAQSDEILFSIWLRIDAITTTATQAPLQIPRQTWTRTAVAHFFVFFFFLNLMFPYFNFIFCLQSKHIHNLLFKLLTPYDSESESLMNFIDGPPTDEWGKK